MLKQELRRYDIILVDFGNDTIGSEQHGIRPAMIIQNDTGNKHSGTTIVMPLTSNLNKNANFPTHTLIKKGKGKGLTSDSIVLGECMRQISEMRIVKFLGRITDEKEKAEIRRIYLANFGE